MTIFIVVAAVMAALAAAAVAVPLLRDRRSRWVGAVAALLIAGSAAGLYPFWSNWNWHAPVQGGPDVQAMIAKLEAHLHDNPNDLTGWVMLGRSYLALDRLDDAILAYDHAHRLDGNNAEATLGLGEAMSLEAGGNITPMASELFEQALKQSPMNAKALLYGGFAAAARGDNAAARTRWEALKSLGPPEEIVKMLDARIAELGGGATAATGPGGGATAASGPDTGAVAAAGPPAAGGEATVNLRIAPALQGRVGAGAQLFVFARDPGAKGPPLVAKRLTTAAIGTQIRLTSADSMIPGRVLVIGQKVSITARVSFSGQPLPAAGDLYGELTYDVGHDGVRDLLIDKVAD